MADTTCATAETMPQIIRAILSDAEGPAEQRVTSGAGENLPTSSDVRVWVSIPIVVGFRHLERGVLSLIAVLEQHGVQRGQWSLASMFADPGIDIPDLPKPDGWRKMRAAMMPAFRGLPKDDLRARCPRFFLSAPRCRPAAIWPRPTSSCRALCPQGGDAVSVDFAVDSIDGLGQVIVWR